MSLEEFELPMTGERASASARVIALTELEPVTCASAEPEKILPSANPIHAVRARLAAQVGTLEMSVGELLSARQGQVLALNQGIEDPVDLLLEGKVVARGQLVALDGCFALRITELPVPLST